MLKVDVLFFSPAHSPSLSSLPQNLYNSSLVPHSSPRCFTTRHLSPYGRTFVPPSLLLQLALSFYNSPLCTSLQLALFSVPSLFYNSPLRPFATTSSPRNPLILYFLNGLSFIFFFSFILYYQRDEGTSCRGTSCRGASCRAGTGGTSLG